jgi:predicted transcriptional regulator
LRPNDPPPPLGDLEIAVLEDIWAAGPSDAKAAHARVGHQRAISLNTVQSGLLQREKISHAYEYSAGVTRAQLVGRLVESTVRRVGGDRSEALLLSAFVDLAARAGEDQLEQLEALIAQRRAELGEGA